MNLETLLSPHLAGYEPRASQQQMADAVAAALNKRGRLIVEAGTGTGKSLAYLIPLIESIIKEDTRAVVSTYTKALQRQLFEKDIPILVEHLYPGLRVALCVGSENYLCLRRLDQARNHGLFDGDPSELESLLRWARDTDDGIREGSGGPLWHSVSREGDSCMGRDCRHAKRCFHQRARERERRSNLLIINHHLFFGHLATGGNLLPEFEHAVFDEAHELEDVAANYLSVELSNLRLRFVLNSIIGSQGRGMLSRMKWLTQAELSHISGLVAVVRSASDAFFDELARHTGRSTRRFKEAGFMDDMLSGPLDRVRREIEALAERSGDDEERKELGAIALKLKALVIAAEGLVKLSFEDHVYWAECNGRISRLVATPVDVAGMHVFEPLGTGIFTSATLATGGNFKYTKERLGLEGADELLIGSPFDYKKQAMLYADPALPAPNSPAYEMSVIKRTGELIAAAKGGTLVLFTSHGFLNRAYESLDVGDIEVLKQGDRDSYALITEFKDNPSSVLLGTYTFWQGVDVPGDALRCVIITRLPFAVPDDPVIQARLERLEAEGKDPFYHYSVPEAAIMLKQGFGRLIRSGADRGVVAILDSRIVTRNYGKEFLNSLPPATRTKTLSDIEKFFAQ